MIVNPPEACPAPIVKTVGTIAELELLLRVTLMPPDGAGPVRVTVAFDEVNPGTVVGLNEIVAT